MWSCEGRFWMRKSWGENIWNKICGDSIEKCGMVDDILGRRVHYFGGQIGL